MAKKGNKPTYQRFGIEKIPTHEENVENGRKGGIASGESRRQAAKVSAAFYAAMGKKAVGEYRELLKKAGYDDEEQTNNHAIMATLIAMALQGDLKAAELLLNYQKTVMEEDRKSEEARVRMETMRANSAGAVTSSDDDDGGVVIYLPKIDDEEESEEAEK